MSQSPGKIVPSDYDIPRPEEQAANSSEDDSEGSNSPDSSDFADEEDSHASVLDDAQCPLLDAAFPNWRRDWGQEIVEIWESAGTLELSQTAIRNYIRKQESSKVSSMVVPAARSSVLQIGQKEKSFDLSKLGELDPHWKQYNVRLSPHLEIRNLRIGYDEDTRVKYSRTRRDSIIEEFNMSERGQQVLQEAIAAMEAEDRRKARDAEMRRLGRRFERVVYVNGPYERIKRPGSPNRPRQTSDDVIMYSPQPNLDNTSRASTSSNWSTRTSRARLSAPQNTPSRWEHSIDSTTTSGFSRLPSAWTSDPRGSAISFALSGLTENTEDEEKNREWRWATFQREAEETLRRFRKTKIGRRGLPEGMLKAIDDGNKAKGISSSSNREQGYDRG